MPDLSGAKRALIGSIEVDRPRLAAAADKAGSLLPCLPPFTQQEPGGDQYRAVVGVQANGHLKGWLVDQENDQLVWFPEGANQSGSAGRKAPHEGANR